MDLHAAIEKNREALRGIVAALVAMVELGAASGSPVSRGGGDAPATLPRHLHRAVLRLLRPAESAARRLVIALARGLAHPLAPLPHPPGPTKPTKVGARKTTSLLVRDGVGTGVVLRPGAPVPPRLAYLVPSKATPRPLSFPLLDPLPRWRGRCRWLPAAGMPSISIAGAARRPAVPARRPPLPDDPLDADRLGRRLTALARALDDLPGLARRFVRWQARRNRALAAGRIHRIAPLRGGRPPGGRLAHYDPDVPRRKNIRDVDEILAHAHALAHHALRHDTS